jgi:hypothetical protein
MTVKGWLEQFNRGLPDDRFRREGVIRQQAEDGPLST